MNTYLDSKPNPESSMTEATLAATGWLLSRGLFAALMVLMFAPTGS